MNCKFCGADQEENENSVITFFCNTIYDQALLIEDIIKGIPLSKLQESNYWFQSDECATRCKHTVDGYRQEGQWL